MLGYKALLNKMDNIKLLLIDILSLSTSRLILTSVGRNSISTTHGLTKRQFILQPLHAFYRAYRCEYFEGTCANRLN